MDHLINLVRRVEELVPHPVFEPIFLDQAELEDEFLDQPEFED